MKHRQSFILHMRPRSFDPAAVSFANTYFLGFLSIFFLVLEFVTGAVLMVYYAPTPDAAYESVVRLSTEVPFGRLVRDLHRLGGECMIVVLVLHMLRVFLSGSYRNQYHLTWVTGVLLLVCTLGLAFSGYLLPWDQLAYWAVTIGTSIMDTIPGIGGEIGLLLRGGPEFGAHGLLRFYLLHIVGIPAVMLLLLAVHYYRISRLHGISLPVQRQQALPGGAREKRPLLPDMVLLDLTLSLLALALLILAVTYLYDAPLEHHADPQHTPALTRAPWFFLWLQGALKLGDSFLMGVCLPLLCLAGLIALPYLDRSPRKPIRQRPVALALLLATCLALAALSYLGLPRFGVHPNPVAALLEEVAPEEGRSPLHQISYADLVQGVYEVGDTSQNDHGTFSRWLNRLSQSVAQLTEQGFPDARGVVLVEDWQEAFKRITVRVHWQDAAGGRQPMSAEKTVYLHRAVVTGGSPLPERGN
ncbi:MAG: cytochrome b N-terminal domain-containing protein [Desulforhopalus sp.]|jgi:quinol-cytochrome oxidoreductase complex cytochrome b subunit|nr:cytochrome b N-terminal domain-containing protein [Desulforhopalus sp.]